MGPGELSREETQITITQDMKHYFSAHKALYALDEEIKKNEGSMDFSPTVGKIMDRPWSIEIYPTMACQIACVHCYAQTRNEEYRFTSMPVEIMERLHQSIANMGIRGVQYCGGGEPLLWKKGGIGNFIAGLDIARTRAGMASNMIMAQALARPDVLQRMTFIEVAVFAYDDRTYQMVAEKKDCISKVDKNVRLLQRVKRENGMESPNINAKILINKINFRWVGDIYRWCQNVGFDNIHLRLVDNYEDGVDVALNQEELLEFRHLLENLCDVHGLTFWRENIPFILGSKGSEGDHVRCWTVRMGLNAWVLANGEVYVCGPQWGRKEYCIGNLKLQPLEEIWGGERHRAIAEKIESNMATSHCYRIGCRHIKQSKVIDSYFAGEVPMPAAADFEKRHAWFL